MLDGLSNSILSAVPAADKTGKKMLVATGVKGLDYLFDIKDAEAELQVIVHR